MKALFILILLALTACSEAPPATPQSGATQRIHNTDIEVSFPVTARAETPFEIFFNFPETITQLNAQLTGVSMAMGRVPVLAKPLAGEANQYSAVVLLGACALPTMQWRLVVTWQASGQTKQFEQIIQVAR